MIAAILKEHFRYGNREPEMCGCGIYKPWARFSEEYEHPVAEETWEEHVAEVIREAIAQEIEAAIENPSDDTVDAYHFDGLDEAARIVRGGTP